MKINGILAGSVLGLLAVVLGAFGAHLLKDNLSPSALSSFETGVRFQMFHAIVLLILGIISLQKPSINLRVIMKVMLIGIVLFSGSIYLLATREMSHLDGISFLGPITPIGGSLLIVGWGMLVVKAAKISTPDK